MQQNVISLFHLALNDDGHLLLGSSETTGRATDMFEPVSSKWHLYRKVGAVRRGRVTIPIETADPRWRFTRAQSEPRRPVASAELLRKLLLDDFAPGAALVTHRSEVLSVHGPILDYLDLPSGELTQDLLKMARVGLRAKLQLGLRKAIREGLPVTLSDARVRRDGGYVPCSITVRPVTEPSNAKGLVLIVFRDREENSVTDVQQVAANGEWSMISQLENELLATREDLQSTIEDLEASTEEMLSMNEELQSSNEELETSKEELQSLNEELATVNNQLQEKVDELDRTNSELHRFMSATDVATVFLDSDLRVQRFSQPSTKVLNLLPTDIGRPFRDLAPQLKDDDLLSDAQQVLRIMMPLEKTVPTDDGRWYLRRILPYRDDARPLGVVLTFVDVTPLMTAEAHARRLSTVLLDSNDAITVCDLDGRITAWNKGAERMYGYSEAEALIMNIDALALDDPRESVLDSAKQASRTGQSRSFETQRRAKDGRLLDVWLTVATLADEDKTPVGIATTERDITEHKALHEEILRIAILEQRHIGQELHDGTQQELVGLGMLAHSLGDALRSVGAERESRLAAQLEKGITEANRHVHSLARGLVPVVVEAKGLTAALKELAKRVQEHDGLPCRFECPEVLEFVNDVTATHMYYIAQEAVLNAVKHSAADVISIRLARRESGLLLEVSDNGIGIPQADTRPERLGLRTMKHRSALVGGTLTIERQRSGGTCVQCTVPTTSNLVAKEPVQ